MSETTRTCRRCGEPVGIGDTVYRSSPHDEHPYEINLHTRLCDSMWWREAAELALGGCNLILAGAVQKGAECYGRAYGMMRT